MEENNVKMLNISKEELSDIIQGAVEKSFAKKVEFMSNNKEFITTEEACELLSVTRQTLRNWKKKKMIHTYALPGSSRVYYKRDEILALLR